MNKSIFLRAIWTLSELISLTYLHAFRLRLGGLSNGFCRAASDNHGYSYGKESSAGVEIVCVYKCTQLLG